MPHPSTKAVITDTETTSLNEEEKALFREQVPYGFILFQRHCESPEQVKRLIGEMYEVTQADWLPVLIDQEGGRVARCKPPHWRKYPAAKFFADMYLENPDKAVRASYLNSYLLGAELSRLGITVNCAPLADIPIEGSDDIIGDRAFGTSPEPIIALARAQAEGLMAAGVLPILKHIPGHGRALVDSHKDLPLVDASLEVLRENDFQPFKALNDLPFGMTAHITYEAVDAEYPATLSPKVLKLIRDEIGFDGLLMGDDLEMKALHTGAFGAMPEIALRSIEAGCDLVLHCNGTFEDRKAVLEAVPGLSEEAVAKAASIQENREMFLDPMDEDDAIEELASFGLRYEDGAV